MTSSLLENPPRYLEFYETRRKEFLNRIDFAKELLKSCKVCPRECFIDRYHKFGFCRIGTKARVSSFFPHFGEEDCLRGWNGSGTIFFTMCNLRCVFCQNYEISQNIDFASREITSEELANIMLYLQSRGVHNINFVSPDHVVPQILEAIFFAIQKGLRIPLVYNSNAYTSKISLELLDGIIDIYMPDFKFWSEDASKFYLKSETYPNVARNAILEMYKQVGDFEVDPFGIAIKGLLVRHLVMPNFIEDSKKILDFLSKVSKNIYLNIMAQYKPANKVPRRKDLYAKINRTIFLEEYREVVEYAYSLGFRNIDHHNI
ncbi:MAG: radical SAM protein [Leptonema sp. (in: bacteria)]